MSALLRSAARKIACLVCDGEGSERKRRRWQDKSSAVGRLADGWFPWDFRAALALEAMAPLPENSAFSYTNAPSLARATITQTRE
jgi:hypothetical protein